MSGIAFSFFLGGILGISFMAWHHSKLGKATLAERLSWQKEVSALHDKASRLESSLEYSKATAESLKAQRDITAAYNQGYDAGVKDAGNMTEAERFAYKVNKGEPARLSRIVDFQGERTVTSGKRSM